MTMKSAYSLPKVSPGAFDRNKALGRGLLRPRPGTPSGAGDRASCKAQATSTTNNKNNKRGAMGAGVG